MSDLQERLAKLNPEQRKLLEQRLRQMGKEPAAAASERSVSGPGNAPGFVPKRKREQAAVEFSLFFFSGDGSTQTTDKYDLLLQSAVFADQHDFAAVWTPERHFEDFGGLYPNPSVLSAALAMTTKRVALRAGSVVLPLHHPIRFTEEWAVVDNLSGGRVSVAFASGWHPADFLLAPARDTDYYDKRKQEMFTSIEQVRALWRGEPVAFTDVRGESHDIRTLPRPIQPELDVWIATNGSPETYRQAAAVGAHILTGITDGRWDHLEESIAMYREELARHGFDPATRKVAVMVHTCLGSTNEEVRTKVEAPLKDYLRTFLRQQRDLMEEYSGLSEADFDSIVSRGFDTYFRENALLGTQEKCAAFVQKLRDIDVQEIACLIDFGVDLDTMMSSLRELAVLQAAFARKTEAVL